MLSTVAVTVFWLGIDIAVQRPVLVRQADLVPAAEGSRRFLGIFRPGKARGGRPLLTVAVTVDAMALRDYWSVVVFGALAAGFLVVAGDSLTKEAAAAAGFAFAGAAVARAVDVVHERRRGAAEEDARRRTDLDETRRLLYMVVMIRGAASPELRATVVNALAHHGLGVRASETAAHLTAIANGDVESEQWLQAWVDEITRRLDAGTVGGS